MWAAFYLPILEEDSFYPGPLALLRADWHYWDRHSMGVSDGWDELDVGHEAIEGHWNGVLGDHCCAAFLSLLAVLKIGWHYFWSHQQLACNLNNLFDYLWNVKLNLWTSASKNLKQISKIKIFWLLNILKYNSMQTFNCSAIKNKCKYYDIMKLINLCPHISHNKVIFPLN